MNRSLRILRCIHSVNPGGGGPIEGIQLVSQALQQRGHSVEIASLDSPDAPWTRSGPLPVHALGERPNSYGYSSRWIPWLREHHGRFDAVVVSGLWQYHGLGTRRALRGTATPYFVFPHGMLDPWFKQAHPLKHLKKWCYWLAAETRVLRDARAVLFTCEEERRRARGTFRPYHCREQVVNYGAARPASAPEAARAEFLARFPELSERRFLIFLGRLHPKKGCDLLIRAFARLASRAAANEKHPAHEWHLVMAGPDQEHWQARLQALARALGVDHRITWTGLLRGEAKLGALLSADAFVLPSHQENFGIAVAEALACGLPVLISDQVNIWREIEADGAGLVAPDDEAGTYLLLERWAKLSAAAKTRMRERAAVCFQSRFDISRAADSLLRVLRGQGEQL